MTTNSRVRRFKNKNMRSGLDPAIAPHHIVATLQEPLIFVNVHHACHNFRNIFVSLVAAPLADRISPNLTQIIHRLR
jgi:hypothetical protein